MLQIQLSPCAHVLADMQTHLGQQEGASAEEQARAQSLRHPQRRAQFLGGRWLLRRMLGLHLGLDPARFRIHSEAGQKPTLPDWPNLHFSISHSGDWVACALADFALGLDLERIKPNRDSLAVAELVCHPDEIATLRALPPDAQADHFIHLWTLKEAQVKCSGLGLGYERARQLQFHPAQPSTADACSWRLTAAGLWLSVAAAPGQLSAACLEAMPPWPAQTTALAQGEPDVWLVRVTPGIKSTATSP